MFREQLEKKREREMYEVKKHKKHAKRNEFSILWSKCARHI